MPQMTDRILIGIEVEVTLVEVTSVEVTETEVTARVNCE